MLPLQLTPREVSNVADAPKVDAPKVDAPKVDAPKVDIPQVDNTDQSLDDGNLSQDKPDTETKQTKESTSTKADGVTEEENHATGNSSWLALVLKIIFAAGVVAAAVFLVTYWLNFRSKKESKPGKSQF